MVVLPTLETDHEGTILVHVKVCLTNQRGSHNERKTKLCDYSVFGSSGLFGVPIVTEESDIEGGRRKVVFSSSGSGLLCVCWLLSASIIYSWCEASKHESVKESHVVRFSRINCENS